MLLSGALLLLAGLSVGDVFVLRSNFRSVTPDLYRSGQLTADQWRESQDVTRYRSVLNLEGAKPWRGWYQAEVKFAAEHGLTHYDYALSADVTPSLNQMREIVALMRGAPKPLLVHCRRGSDRTGLAAALYRFAIEGQPDDVAGRQLSVWYGHFPWLGSGTQAMDDAFSRFVASKGTQTVASEGPANPF